MLDAVGVGGTKADGVWGRFVCPSNCETGVVAESRRSREKLSEVGIRTTVKTLDFEDA